MPFTMDLNYGLNRANLQPQTKLPKSTCNKATMSKPACNQTQSLLFQMLPLEIRSAIWTEVVGGRLLHMGHQGDTLVACTCTGCIWTGRRLYIERCSVRGKACPYSKHAFPHICFGWWPNSDQRSELNGERRITARCRVVGYVKLLQTCQVVYQETVSVIYKSNMFDFRCMDTLVVLRERIPRPSLNEIRAISIMMQPWPRDAGDAQVAMLQWREACAVLRSLTNLRRLAISMPGVRERRRRPETMEGSRYLWEPALRHLDEVGPVKDFVLSAWWTKKECAVVQSERDYPFRIQSELVRWAWYGVTYCGLQCIRDSCL